ncbi:hypothetical protein PJ311_07145 [Bacillus sp. CLL-7-23]|uniref:Uncharacterized protein n=1 Tax=Bacillus changyiensis TaxID=3004103 RepID=A0ABT4X2I5_9BACI|nr:hypothetical protein [Bacillus changyiensis]MDA7026393.1 hypothetical protein [Bacillus changyiensis]
MIEIQEMKNLKNMVSIELLEAHSSTFYGLLREEILKRMEEALEKQ